jgi:tetratricopeptide (TPR) repeat protein
LTFVGRLPILPGMKQLLGGLLTGIALCAANFTVCAETEQIDLKALAKKARPAVMLLVISDANGKEIATGTGFLVSADGKLITNFHVIEKAASAVAKAENGGLFPVEGVLASNPKNDLVLLKIKGKELPVLTLGKSENIEVGTRVAVIGSPLGLEGTLSEGIVSAVRELMGDIKKLQITAAISSGSSGSPVMDAKGDVIGIAVAQLKGGQALNLAVLAKVAMTLIAGLKPNVAPQALTPPVSTGENGITQDPDYVGAVYEWEDGVKALKHAKALVARYPEHPDAFCALGHAYKLLKFVDEAVLAFRQAVKLQPDLPGSWYWLASACVDGGKLEDAIAACRQAIKLAPDNADYWDYLGTTCRWAGKLDEALAAFQQATKLEPEKAGRWSSLGLANEQSGRLADAIIGYRQACKLAPKSAGYWYLLGSAYEIDGKREDAIDAYRLATKLEPVSGSSVTYRRALAKALQKSGKLDEVVAIYQQETKLKPDDAYNWSSLFGSVGHGVRGTLCFDSGSIPSFSHLGKL